MLRADISANKNRNIFLNFKSQIFQGTSVGMMVKE
jgi:hypothetical protein